MNMPSLHKLMHPILPPNALHRKALVAELVHAVNGSLDQTENKTEGTGYKTILLCAPAGYGKTTLLTDFVSRVSFPCCWYFLDSTDEDAVVFFHLLLKSIRKRFPTFGPTLETQLDTIAEVENHEQRLQYLEMYIDTFIQVIVEDIPARFALLLCNYHEISSKKVTNALINRFIQNIPPQCTLIFESRATPKLDFTSLLTNGQLLTIGSNKLRFSSQEIHELVRLHQMNLTVQEAEYLEQLFEGWIAGILLGTHLGNTLIPLVMHSSKNSGNLPIGKTGREYLFTYLVKHVFAHQSEAYSFLQETAVLPRMTPVFCNTLLTISDAESRLTYLAEQGLFVTHYSNGSEHVFLCHPVLRELLYDELQITAPHHLTELHLRAVELFRHSDTPEAIAHALAAGAFSTAAQLIEGISARQFAQGYLATLARWIDSIPSEITSCYPRLLLTRANIFLEASALPNVQPLVEQALAALHDTQAASPLQAEILLTQAKLLLQQGQYLQAQSLCKQTLTLLSNDEVELRAIAHQLLGSCAAYLNKFADCFVELQQALRLYQYNTRTYQVAKIHTILANSYGVTGHNALSEHHRTRAIQLWESIHDEWGRIDNVIGLGAIKERQGASEEAEQLLTQALRSSRGTIHYECGEAYALANLGDLYQNQDKFRQALEAFEDSLVLSRQLNETYLTHYLICQMSRTYQLLGDIHSAMHIISQLDYSTHSVDIASAISYEQAQYYLTFGAILLQIDRAVEAYQYLKTAEQALIETKYEHIAAMIQVAACLFAQRKRQAALQHIESALHQAEKYDYKELVQRELTRCPDFLTHLKNSVPTLIQNLTVQEHISDLSFSSNSPSAAQTSSYQPTSVLAIQSLGVPMVYKNSLLIAHWRTNRSMELFFLLLNASHPLPKERILADLWHNGKEPTDQAWRSTLYYLRQALGTDCIKFHNGVYTLQLETRYNVNYDVDDFYTGYTQAQAAQQIGDYKTAGLIFEKTADLYKGDFVSLFHSNWCIPKRNEMRQMYIDVHNQLALIAWQQQQLDKSIYHWQHMVEIDGTLEIAHEGLIRCYLQQGKRHLALQQYNRCTTLLREEMNIAPSQTLQSLYQHVTKSSPLP